MFFYNSTLVQDISGRHKPFALGSLIGYFSSDLLYRTRVLAQAVAEITRNLKNEETRADHVGRIAAGRDRIVNILTTYIGATVHHAPITTVCSVVVMD